MVAEAIRTARTAGAGGEILVRGDSAYGSSVVINACITAGARFSFVLITTAAVAAAIAAITEDAWMPVHYPGAVLDLDTGHLISDAEVAEIEFTAFASTKTPVTARLIVRRVRDRARLDELFPVWRYHPFLTNSSEPTAAADITHRRHAIIETVFADLIDGPLAHLPSGRFNANAAWVICAAITHNLLRAAGTLAGGRHAVARGATLRRQLITVPARLARPQRRPGATPARALALGPALGRALDRRDRTTRRSLTPHSTDRGHRGKAGQTNRSALPAHPTIHAQDHLVGPEITRDRDPRIEAKKRSAMLRDCAGLLSPVSGRVGGSNEVAHAVRCRRLRSSRCGDRGTSHPMSRRGERTSVHRDEYQ